MRDLPVEKIFLLEIFLKKALKIFLSVVIFFFWLSSEIFSVEKPELELYFDALLEEHSGKKELLLRKAHRINPKEKKIAYQLLKVLLDRKDEKSAEELTQRVWKDSKESRVYKLWSEYCQNQKQWDKSRFYLEKLIQSGKRQDNYVNHYNLARVLRNLKHYTESSGHYEKAYAMRKSKKDEHIKLLLSENFFWLKDYSNSLYHLESYPYTNQNNQKAFRLLITLHLKLNQTQKAEKFLEEYQKIWSSDPWLKTVRSN